MKANEEKLLVFLEGHDKSFMIPVYQRSYSWTFAQCRQLFEDIKDVIKNKRQSHFFGSVVYLYNDDTTGRECIIIDGQQRITTISLLFLAILQYATENKLSNSFLETIKDEYVFGKYTGEKKVKLKLIKEDSDAFDKICELAGHSDLIEKSNVTQNYLYFYEEIKKQEISIQEIFEAVKKLMIVEIKLKGGEDDPQLIFESLNSTGLDLTEADKIRNYILMGVTYKEQQKLYDKFWLKIEKNCSLNTSNFIRDFLSYKNNVIPNKNRVFFTFKDYCLKGNLKENIEPLLGELLKFSNFYETITTSNFQDEKVNNLLEDINKLEITVCYPFLLDVFEKNNSGAISNEDVKAVLQCILTFAFRRLICGLSTNALNKIFLTFKKDIEGNNHYNGSNYVDILKYIISSKTGNQRCPNDMEFARDFIIKDIYNMQSKNTSYLFDKLENFENKERVSLAELQIEHIMPQTLSAAWKEYLGEEYQEIYDSYLHTIGNLTLTGYNQEYKNYLFNKKQTCEKGFNQSNLKLNSYLKTIDKWGKDEINYRADEIKNWALKIWEYENPTKAYKEMKNRESYSLDDNFDPTNRNPESFEFNGDIITVSSWIDLYKKAIKVLFSFNPTEFYQTIDNEKTPFIRSKNEGRRIEEIQHGVFLEVNLSAIQIINNLKKILEILKIESDDFNILLKN